MAWTALGLLPRGFSLLFMGTSSVSPSSFMSTAGALALAWETAGRALMLGRASRCSATQEAARQKQALAEETAARIAQEEAARIRAEEQLARLVEETRALEAQIQSAGPVTPPLAAEESARKDAEERIARLEEEIRALDMKVEQAKRELEK